MMTNLKPRWIFLVLCSLLLAGCSWFTWLPWVDGDEEVDPSEPAELVDFDAEIDIKRLWKGGIGQGLGKKYLRLTPVIVAERIIAADAYGLVEARDRFSGKLIWRTEIGSVDGGWFSSFDILDRRDPSFVTGGVGVGGGRVFLGTTEGEVIALDVADGAEIWRADLKSEVLAAPTAARELVFAQTIDGRLVAMDLDSGESKWFYDNQLPILTLRGTSAPVVENDIVYTGFANGKVLALRAENGEPIWEHRVMLPEGRSELDRMVDVDTTPLLSGANVFVGAYQGRVKALSRRDGRPRWEQEISTYLNLSTGYSQVYTIDEGDVITALNADSGEVVWVQEDFKNRRLSSPIAFSNYLAFGDEEGYLHVIAQRDGRHLARRKIDRKGVRSGLIVADGTLFVMGNSGSLQALNLELK